MTAPLNPALTSAEYWEKMNYDRLSVCDSRSSFQEFFDRFLPANPEWSVLEIGACPGKNLLALSRSHHYKPVALDILPAVHGLLQSFQELGLPGGRVLQEDFLRWTSSEQFPVVMSFGFVEHFEDYEAVIAQHWAHVASGGILLVGVPVLGPAQMLLRRLILNRERLREILSVHNLKIMDVRRLRKVCAGLPGSELLFADHIWEMRTWYTESDPHVLPERRRLLDIWRRLSVIPHKLHWSSRLFSPYCLVIAQKQPLSQ